MNMNEQEQQRLSLIAGIRATVKYVDEVAKWEPFFFRGLVAVQLRDAIFQMEHRGVRKGRERVLDYSIDEQGHPLGFSVTIPSCLIQPSEVPDMLRLIVPADRTSDPPKLIEIHPGDIMYVTSLGAPEDEQRGSASRIVSPVS